MWRSTCGQTTNHLRTSPAASVARTLDPATREPATHVEMIIAVRHGKEACDAGRSGAFGASVSAILATISAGSSAARTRRAPRATSGQHSGKDSLRRLPPPPSRTSIAPSITFALLVASSAGRRKSSAARESTGSKASRGSAAK